MACHQVGIETYISAAIPRDEIFSQSQMIKSKCLKHEKYNCL